MYNLNHFRHNINHCWEKNTNMRYFGIMSMLASLEHNNVELHKEHASLSIFSISKIIALFDANMPPVLIMIQTRMSKMCSMMIILMITLK